MSTTGSLLLRHVEVAGEQADVSCTDGRISAVQPAGTAPAADVVLDGEGGALLPGLHDHHVHLLATAAALGSVDCADPAIADAEQLGRALRAAARPGEWVRAVGYHETLAGPLDRAVLDRLAPDRPVRVQHASGGLWILNSAALGATGIGEGGLDVPAGVERDAAGQPTGRLWRLDEWLGARLPDAGTAPDLRAVGERLASVGVTAVTDTTPFADAGGVELLAGAVSAGDLPQRVVITGAPGLPARAAPELARGPVKVVLHDHEPPPLAQVTDQLRAARAAGRPVALHCVTAEALVLAVAALRDVGPRRGDRIEHGAVVLPGMHADLAALGVVVVTQPAMVRVRGDRYLGEVDEHELPHLWPCRSLLDAGIPVAAGTDAPYGPLDPWTAMDAAVTRRTARGAVLGEHQRIDPGRALALFLGELDEPAGPARRVRPGARADLCLLDVPAASALAERSARRVAATVIGGEVAWRASGS